ncbi:MAG TPA: ferritin-like protein [Myxococcaceae bacterium]|jgi:rubrerythrin
MLRISPSHLEGVRSAQAPADLYRYLQKAVELEHSTIPPYLTALYTLKPGTNRDIAAILISIVREEMLHMTIAGNLLTALGGAPIIDQPGFVPTYPGPLPMNVGEGLIVGLKRFSKPVVSQVFMQIEKPEKPIDYPVKSTAMKSFAAAMPPVPEPEQYPTIGDFYNSIRKKIRELYSSLGPAIFKGDPARQVLNTSWFPADELFPIRTMEDVDKAITLIIEQGEGSTGGPQDEEDDLAHYYRFAEIFNEYRLQRDASVPQGWSYSGPRIEFDPSNVFDMPDNPKVEQYPVGSRSRFQAEQFNQAYTQLLRALHQTFNGQPGLLEQALGLMFQLRILAYQVLSTPDQNNQATGLTFQYTATP